MESVKLFVSYSHKDELLREELDAHLSSLKREGIISGWHDAYIPAGEDIDDSIKQNLESADIVILLISAYFLASDYCYNIEMTKALEKSNDPKSATKVIPIIIKPCDWKNSPFKNIKVLPRDGKPVTSWGNNDEAWENVIQGLRSMISNVKFSTKQEDVDLETGQSSYNLNHYLKESVDRIDECFNTEYDAFSLTGIQAIDDHVGNHSIDSLCLFLNDDIKLASDFNTLIALNFALDKALSVDYLTFDISSTQLILRLISQHSKIPLEKFLSEYGLEDEDWPKLSSSISKLKDSKINLIDVPEKTLEKQIERISILSRKEKNIIIIQGLDYLDDSSINSEEVIRKLLNKIKILCKQNKKTIIISMNSAMITFQDKVSTRLASIADLCIKLKNGSLQNPLVDNRCDFIINVLRNSSAVEKDIFATHFQECCTIEDKTQST